MRTWTARILIEAMSHEHSLFVTMTYAPEHLPHKPRSYDGLRPRGFIPSLVPGHLTRFWKRLRKRIPHPIRYFACGEYGDLSWRPHYHAIIFGLSAFECVQVQRHLVHPDVQAAWGLGFTSAGELTPERGAYVAQYVTKKFTKNAGEFGKRQLDGREPEFQRASRRPGIGALEVERIAEALLHADPAADDIPTTFVLDGRSWPVSTFLATKVREELGIPVLARDRPPREVKRDPDDERLVVLKTGTGSVGQVTRTITRREQKALEAERKAERRARKRRQEAQL